MVRLMTRNQARNRMSSSTERVCPVCGNTQVTVTPRGYSGRVDSPDQYIVCQECGQRTYEIIAVSQRDIRLNRYQAHGTLEHDGVVYQIRRVLKVGFNEYLIYIHREPSKTEGDDVAPEQTMPPAAENEHDSNGEA